MIFLILGPSGCGKGTQAELLAKRFGLVHLSTGDLLRQAYLDGNPLGIKAHRWVTRGRWPPTNLVAPLLREALRKLPGASFVLEGWPRLSEQKDLLKKYLDESRLRIDKVFYLDTPREVSFGRAKERFRRALAAGQAPRADDHDEIINRRLDSYYQTVGPILDYYRRQGLLEVVDNRPSAKVVFREILRRLDGRN